MFVSLRSLSLSRLIPISNFSKAKSFFGRTYVISNVRVDQMRWLDEEKENKLRGIKEFISHTQNAVCDTITN